MSDYNFLMESRLSPEQNAVLALISRLAAEHGQNLYLVGGAVRDLTQGQQVVRDLDFVVTGSPQRILRALPGGDSAKPRRGEREAVGATAPLAVEYQEFDERLSSAELLFSNGVRAELAMCREEIHASSGQRPEVRPAAIFDDLKRRDFAINAMAVSLHPNSRGLLLDPTNGAGDIERQEIRALQSRSFLDDPSRIYRMLRLAMRFEFKTDERTQRWFDAALEEGAWERLDAHEQARELAAILHEDQPGRILKALADRKLLGGLDKKLASVHLPYERFARIRTVLQHAPGANPFLLNFHCLVEKLGGEHKAQLARKIVRDDKTIKLLLSFDHEARKIERSLSSPKAELNSQVYYLLAPHPQPVLLYLLTTTKSAKVQNRIKNFLFKFPQVQARLPRTELQSLGIKAGPEFDRIISKIFAMQLDGKISSHQQLMKEMRALAGIKEPPPPPPPPPPTTKKGKEAQSAAVPRPSRPMRKKGGEAAPAAPPASVQHSAKQAAGAAKQSTPPAEIPKPAGRSAAKTGAQKPAAAPSPTAKPSVPVKATTSGKALKAPKALSKPAEKLKPAGKIQRTSKSHGARKSASR